MPESTRTPSYRHHKPSGQAVVTIDSRDHYLGRHGTSKSRQRYDALIAEWLSGGRTLPARTVLTVAELVAQYWRFAEKYYRKNGEPTVEIQKLRSILRPLVRLYGVTPASQFGPLALKAIRQTLLVDGYTLYRGKKNNTLRRKYARRHINDSMCRLRRIFKWGVENELVPPSVYHGLQAIAGLKQGRCEARETEPVRPVPDDYVDAIAPHVSRQVWAMVELQRLTGMRSGEVVIMRPRDLDTSGKLWFYRPASHKTEHLGHERIVELGPRARAVIRPFLKPDLGAFLFSPIDAEAERRQAMQAKRKTPISCGNRPGTNRKRKPERTPKDRYTPDSYRRAIARASDLADREAKKRKSLPLDSERIIPQWHPHQLRHNYATRVRKEYGIETARILLGHRSAIVTEIYAEVDRTKARKIVAKIG